MTIYQDRRKWSDGFIPEICYIVGARLLVPASMYEDCNHATDLMVFKARDMRIAARVRRRSWMTYVDEFTMRCVTDNGNGSELTKIINGWGDWFFYGFAADDENPSVGFTRWSIFDLDVFRATLIRNRELLVRGNMLNNDGGSSFFAFKIIDFPSDLVVASV